MSVIMSTSYIPKGFHSLTPYLIVEDAEALVKFIKEAFDGEEVLLMKGDDGAIMHGAFKIGDSMVELGSAKSPWKPLAAGLHLYVKDTDKTYQQALDAGGTSLYEPKDMFYGERSGGVADPCGNQWYIATKTEEMSQKEMELRAAAAGCG
jgi:PhnB protein